MGSELTSAVLKVDHEIEDDSVHYGLQQQEWNLHIPLRQAIGQAGVVASGPLAVEHPPLHGQHRQDGQRIVEAQHDDCQILQRHNPVDTLRRLPAWT